MTEKHDMDKAFDALVQHMSAFGLAVTLGREDVAAECRKDVHATLDGVLDRIATSVREKIQ